MSTNKIYCLGDGFAHGHIWPEWPQILQALLPSKDIVTITGIGSGHEFLISGLLDQSPCNSDVLFQWPMSNRFDKLIEDQRWIDRIKNDPVYFFNVYPSPHGSWWLSSASLDPDVRHYHDNIIQKKQHIRRLEMAKILIKSYLESRNCRYLEFSNEDQENFIQQKYHRLRGTEIQPGPLVHYYYVIETLIPKLGYEVAKSTATTLEKRIRSHAWKPYDPDRIDLWQKMISQLDTE